MASTQWLKHSFSESVFNRIVDLEKSGISRDSIISEVLFLPNRADQESNELNEILSQSKVPVFDSERFLYRPILKGDVYDLFELDSDPLVHQYLGNQPLTELQQAFEVIDMIHEQYQQNGIGRWSVIEKSTGEWLGWSGLRYYHDGMNIQSNYLDIGYRLKRFAWGKGVATESALAWKHSADLYFNNTRLAACATTTNKSSIRVLEKIGLRIQETFIFHDENCYWLE